LTKDHSIAIVVAASSNNAIGKDNQLLWHLPNDLRFFKNTTWGGVVIMGRKTFESVNKPLPGRLNIVISSNKDWKADQVVTAAGLSEAIAFARGENFKQIFIIGGGVIYQQALAITDTVYLTRVHAEIDGDTFFPALDQAEWKLISKSDFPKDEKHAFAYSFEKWERTS
jgi:dihydrofolate reductase